MDTIKSILKRKLVLYIISVAGPTLLTIFGFLVALVIFLVAISGGPNGSGGTSSCGNEPESSITVDGIVSSSAASDADWTKPGTTAYKTAKKVFMAWVNLGLDGGAAAGIVGWTQTEGGTVMIGRAEGHFGNDIKANSIMYGNVPIGQSYYKTAAGGGIYQFTPYTKYAPLNDPKWEDADAMNDFVAKAILNGDWNAGMDMSGKSRSFEQMAKEKDPQSATLTWQAYERGNPAQIPVEKKKADSQKAYEIFKGSEYSFNQEKFDKHFKNAKASGANNSSTSTFSEDDEEMCDSDPVGGGSTNSGHPLAIPYTINQGLHHIGAIDLGAPEGTPIYAVSDGKVTEVNETTMGINGNYVIHTVPDGTVIYYGHMRDVPMVKKGDKVKKGQQIGVVGQTGMATGPHIHFDRRSGSNWGPASNPFKLISDKDSLPTGTVIDPNKDKR